MQVTGALDGPPQMPDGEFILDEDPWSGSMQRFIATAQPKGIAVCKQRRATGRDGLGKLGQPSSPGRRAHRQTDIHSERRRA